VLEIYRRMKENGDIYKGEYAGWYCTGCEAFLLEGQLKGKACPDCGREAEWLKEESYYFRLSKYQQPLLEHYRAHPDFVQPETRYNETLRFVQGGLKDLSISRTSFSWGIPVPGDEKHIFYVWVDALTNYISALGFGQNAPLYKTFWPADVHLIGKDILRFHAVYWPAMLLSAGIPLPKRVYAHGWWLVDQAKMSKSVGNIVDPVPIIRNFGADTLRYFVLREIPFGNDGNYSDEAFIGRYNSDLANDYGNLLNRTLNMITDYFEGKIPSTTESTEGPLKAVFERTFHAYKKSFSELTFNRALAEIWEFVSAGNKYVDMEKPWFLAKAPEKRDHLAAVLYHTAEAARLISIMLHPVMPESTLKALEQLGLPRAMPSLKSLRWGDLKAGDAIGKREPLFPKIDMKKYFGLPDSEKKPRPAAPAKEAAPQSKEAPQAREAAPQAKEPVPPTVELLSIEEFARIDLRSARILEAEKLAGSKKLIKMKIDIGTETRQIVAGIAEKYGPADLIGKTILVVVNLKPAKLMGTESRGMLLAAIADGLPILATFDEDVPPGSKVK
jgi:methionyl-tRNA synthetase